jgi:NTP pyrophosphatase (non-canonical NTP hydrolase)
MEEDMKRHENLFLTVMEECDEVSQAVSKSLRFGLDNHHPESDTTNAYDIMKEYYQLTALITYLQKVDYLPILDDDKIESIMEDKMKNVFKYQEVSFKEGTLDSIKNY